MADDGERARQWAEEVERMSADVLERWHFVPPIAPLEMLMPERILTDGHLADLPRPLNLAVNLIPGRRRPDTDEAEQAPPAAVSPTIDAILEQTLGKNAAQDFAGMSREFDKHADMLDAYLTMPSSVDDVQPRLTAASGLMAAMNPFVDAVARAGMNELGPTRREMVKLCVAHKLKQATLARLTTLAAELDTRPAHLFITGEYER